MLQHAVYSVISPEGCAVILWNDPKKAPDAAEALKMTAEDLLRLGVVDEIISEPPGGAHRDPMAMCDAVKKALELHLSALLELPLEELLRRRTKKYRRIGVLGGE
jgi:acetyl-CoA carboxylase alpha subunit